MAVVGDFYQPAGGVGGAARGGGGRPAQHGAPGCGGEGGQKIVAFQGRFAPAFRRVVGQPGADAGARRELAFHHSQHIHGVVGGANYAGRRAEVYAGAYRFAPFRHRHLQTFPHRLLQHGQIIFCLPLFQPGQLRYQIRDFLPVVVRFARPEVPAVALKNLLQLAGCPIPAGLRAVQGAQLFRQRGYEFAQLRCRLPCGGIGVARLAVAFRDAVSLLICVGIQALLPLRRRAVGARFPGQVDPAGGHRAPPALVRPMSRPAYQGGGHPFN